MKETGLFTVEQRILNYLLDGEPKRFTDIREHLKKDKGFTHRVLNKMLSKGLIQRHGVKYVIKRQTVYWEEFKKLFLPTLPLNEHYNLMSEKFTYTEFNVHPDINVILSCEKIDNLTGEDFSTIFNEELAKGLANLMTQVAFILGVKQIEADTKTGKKLPDDFTDDYIYNRLKKPFHLILTWEQKKE